MAWEFRILVVANVTADSPELIAALKDRASRRAARSPCWCPRRAGGKVGREAARSGWPPRSTACARRVSPWRASG